MEKKLVLVTGITGKSGRWFLENLLQENLKVKDFSFRATVRTNSNIKQVDKNLINLEYVTGNLEELDFIHQSMKEVHTVFHIADLGFSVDIVKAAIANNVKRIILVHTTGIYSKYKSACADYFKIEGEIRDLLKDKDINLSILRPTMIYGSIGDENVVVFMKMINVLKIFPIVNHGKYLLQPVHEKDLGQAYFDILLNEEKTKNKEYILSGKEPILLIDMLKTIKNQLGKRNIFISVPFPIAYFFAFCLFLLSLGRIDFRERVQRLIEPRAYPHHEASNDFGYSPRSFEEGIKSEILEFINSKKKK